jgi:hypothetical protein
MATYIETLKKQNGDQIAPRTVAKAVTMENGQTVENAINSKVNATEVDSMVRTTAITKNDVYVTDSVLTINSNIQPSLVWVECTEEEVNAVGNYKLYIELNNGDGYIGFSHGDSTTEQLAHPELNDQGVYCVTFSFYVDNIETLNLNIYGDTGSITKQQYYKQGYKPVKQIKIANTTLDIRDNSVPIIYSN